MYHYYCLLKFHWESLKQLAISCLLPKVSEGYGVQRDDLLGERLRVQHIPDDILVDILSRLPAEKVLEFRRVCKHWKTLTSSPTFISQHERNTSPSIILAYFPTDHLGYKEDRVFLLDEWEETSTSNIKIKRLGPKKSIYPVPIRRNRWNSMHYNHHGLIVFYPGDPVLQFPYVFRKNRLRHSNVLYNPVTRQKMVLNVEPGFICGYFYHTLADEYRIIYCEWRDRYSPIMYRMLNLGSPTWRNLANFDYLPVVSYQKPFLLNNKFIHWITSERNYKAQQPRCNHAILAFDINKEEFSTMPHPGRKCTTARSRHGFMHLLELKCDLKSLLCLCNCSIQDQIEMWVLEDYDERIWVRRHTVVLNSVTNRFRVPCQEVPIPFGLVNGEMLINVGNLGVFSYNISTGSLRRIIEVNGRIGNDPQHYSLYRVGLFYKSLASFTNFKGLHFNMDPH